MPELASGWFSAGTPFVMFLFFGAMFQSFSSPYFILTVPVDAIGYCLLWGNGANGALHARHAAEPAN